MTLSIIAISVIGLRVSEEFCLWHEFIDHCRSGAGLRGRDSVGVGARPSLTPVVTCLGRKNEALLTPCRVAGSA